MIAQRFRSIGWVACCAGAALCCYLASQSVAAERASLARVDREIASTSSDIRRLNTEIAARGRMGQIERWNTEVLALQAPAPGQFVADEVQLASLAGGKGLPLDQDVMATKGAVRTVAYQPDAAPAATAAPTPVSAEAAPAVHQPMLRPATFVRSKPAAMDAPETGIVKASMIRTKPFSLDLDADAPAEDAKPVKIAPPRPVTPVAKASTAAAKSTVAPAKVADAAAKKPAKAADEPARKPAVVAAKAKAAPEKAPLKPATVTASLLPTDLGKLIAAEKKGAKASRASADR
ncbi:hypothetical protein HL653_08500 [Sphingomonas sp. AP4-R1]|uniref:hypothetical protein n=1 Tax=Sphingomonas sp. AP4-R1 TaxID=2735134 RepID=UPI0014934BEE|nr:hypothetical protein [Sphingomonas sp. AP4-R1]QJU57823.1 hypothetical protein HL653_08500 [Sphingomonas sp. AP4-R1]